MTYVSCIHAPVMQVSVSSGMATPLSLKNRDQIVVGRVRRRVLP